MGATAAPRWGNRARVLLVGGSIMDEAGSDAVLALRNMGVDARVYGAWGSSLYTRNQYDCGELRTDSTGFSWLVTADTLIHPIEPDLVFFHPNPNYGPDLPETPTQSASTSEASIGL